MNEIGIAIKVVLNYSNEYNINYMVMVSLVTTYLCEIDDT